MPVVFAPSPVPPPYIATSDKGAISQAPNLRSTIERFELLVEEAVFMTNEAADYMMATRGRHAHFLSPLSSFDGQDDIFISAPSSQDPISKTQDDIERLGHRDSAAAGHSRRRPSKIKIPTRVASQTHSNNSPVELPQDDIYHKGRAASYYQDFAYGDQHLRKLKRQQMQNFEEQPNNPVNKKPKRRVTMAVSPLSLGESTPPLRRGSHPIPSPWNHSPDGHTARRQTFHHYPKQEPGSGFPDAGEIEMQNTLRRELDPSPPHFALTEGGHIQSLRRQPAARKWNTPQKRLTALVACLNTFNIGFQIGIYAGMVPQIQYQLADEKHYAIQGNIYLYIGMAISTFIFWPLPLLHGRKPYILAALAFVIPLQFPQAIIVMVFRSPNKATFRAGLLVSRLIIGFLLGFANVNFFTTLLDLFGASLQSTFPHQELVNFDDPRRDGGGLGMWLGFWTWCFIGSIAIGFTSGAAIINNMNPQWGFYIGVFIIVVTLAVNVLTPETRRSPWRRTTKRFLDHNEQIRKLVGRGEVKLHISTNPPKHWWEEVWAGIKLSGRMVRQSGFLLLTLYLGWIYAQLVLVVVLLAALLSREYRFRSNKVAAGVLSVAVGALIAVPLTRANWFSRARSSRPRSDSTTMQHHKLSWSSHMARRVFFMMVLPFAGLAYTLASQGRGVHYMVPIVFAGLMGFLSNLAIAECLGLIMETFDTSDLQPGVNSRHRLQSMATIVRRRRTNYSSFPRVSAGFFVSQTLSYLFAAAFTGLGGVMTRRLGAQLSIGATAAILLGLTLLLTIVLWRFKHVKVIPDKTFGTDEYVKQWTGGLNRAMTDDWKAVIIGNPSGQIRRMNLLELGNQSRWTEIRRLNRLLRDE